MARFKRYLVVTKKREADDIIKHSALRRYSDEFADGRIRYHWSPASEHEGFVWYVTIREDATATIDDLLDRRVVEEWTLVDEWIEG